MIQTNVAFHNILRNHRYIFRKIHKHAAGNRFTMLCLISKKGFGKSMDVARLLRTKNSYADHKVIKLN